MLLERAGVSYYPPVGVYESAPRFRQYFVLFGMYANSAIEHRIDAMTRRSSSRWCSLLKSSRSFWKRWSTPFLTIPFEEQEGRRGQAGDRDSAEAQDREKGLCVATIRMRPLIQIAAPQG
jgi:hypothetical protein